MFRNFFKKDELRLLWPFYFDCLFVSIFFLYPAFYVIYMRDLGLSLFQIGLLTSSMSLSAVLFEIPTGAIADIFGRKLSVILGLFLSGLIVISVFFFKDFYTLLFLFFIWGAVGTLMSGAGEAWVVDLLKHEKRKNLIQEYYIKRHSFFSFAFLIMGVVGALLVKKFGLSVIWPITGGSMLITSFVFLFAKEHFIKKKQKISKHIKELFSHSKKSINYSINHQGIFLMLLGVIGLALIVSLAGDITWYPLLQNLGFKEYWFGYLFSATFALGIFIPYFIKPLIKISGGYVKYLLIILSVQFLLLFLMGFVNILIPILLIYILFMTTYDFFHPADITLFQKFVPSPMRATIGSFRNMLMSLIAIIFFPLAGFIADKIGPQNTIFIGAFVLIPMIIIYSKIKE
ncbi:MAG: MFS transporter [Candidatus Pacearchaeota archaeon]